MAKHILIPIDGSPLSETALEFACEEWPNADIVLVTVINPVESGYRGEALSVGSEAWYERARERAVETLTALAATIDRSVETRVVVGRPATSIVEAAADADHVVMGSHGRTGVSRILLGSVAEDVVRKAPVPVTIVR